MKGGIGEIGDVVRVGEVGGIGDVGRVGEVGGIGDVGGVGEVGGGSRSWRSRRSKGVGKVRE